MGNAIIDAADEFRMLSDRIEAAGRSCGYGSSVLKVHTGFNGPNVKVSDISKLAKDVSSGLIDLANRSKSVTPDLEDKWKELSEQARLVDFNSVTSDPVNVFRSTLEFLVFCLIQLPPRRVDVDWEEVKDSSIIPRKLKQRIQGIEARLDAIEPSSKNLEAKIALINAAHDAAEQLPTDLRELEESRDRLERFEEDSAESYSEISQMLDATKQYCRSKETEIEKLLGAATEKEKQASAIVERCEHAYRIATSTGLAAAFQERARRLEKSASGWLGLLAVSLFGLVLVGHYRLSGFKELLTSNPPTSLVVLNLLIAILGVAGPIWLAWIATRNLGSAIRMAEDYSFKASVSRAYEGYRKEAVSMDESFARRLFGSALDRLDEPPSRFMPKDDASSPLESFLSNPITEKLFEKFPDLKSAAVNVTDKLESAARTVVANATDLLPPPKAPHDAQGKTSERDEV